MCTSPHQIIYESSFPLRYSTFPSPKCGCCRTSKAICGKASSVIERNKKKNLVFSILQEFLKAKDLPEYISVSVELEGHESLFFSSKFYDWPEPVVTSSPVKTSNIGMLTDYLFKKCKFSRAKTDEAKAGGFCTFVTLFFKV